MFLVRPLLLSVALALAGCSSQTATDSEPLGQSRSAIIAGTASDATQDSVVMLVFTDVDANRRDICTAALVAPRLVLTARHCVSETDPEVKCSADGSPVKGGAIRATHDARKLFVFTGKDRPDLDPTTWKPAGRGIEVLDDDSKNLCDHDIAFVLLEQPITGVPIAPLRLDGDAEKDERLLTVGWGITADVLEPAHRQQRAAVLVTRVGPDNVNPELTPNEFTFDESICLGDSGGPVLSEKTGAVVGVVSRGGNGFTSDTDLAASCIKATNLGTKLSPFRDLVMRSFTRAQAEPQLEVRPPKADDDSGCAVVGTRRLRASHVVHPSLLLLYGLAAVAFVRRRCR